MGKDCNGIDRGRCNKPNCNCVQFLYDKEKGVKCSNCGHVPAKHSAVREGLLVDVAPVSETDDVNDEEASVAGIYEDVSAGSIFERDGARVNNVDSQGTVRGRCAADGCVCIGFVFVASRGRKCDECGHAPVKHIKVTEGVFDGCNPTTDKSGNWVEVGKPPAFASPQVVESSNSERLPSPLKTFSSISLSPPPPPVKRRLPSANLTGDRVVVKQETISGRPSTSHPSQVPGRSKKIRRNGPKPVSVPTQATDLDVQQTPSLPVTLQSQPVLVIPPHSLPVSPSSQRSCMYPGCSRPVHVESDGRAHKFCSLTHATTYRDNVLSSFPPHLKCSNPSCNRMKFQQDNGRYFDYCRKSCRDSCRDLHPEELLSQAQPVRPDKTCLFPGCGSLRYHDPQTGATYDYCGTNHAKQAKRRFIRMANRQEFQQIQTHFTQQWARRKGACGHLYQVLVINNPKLRQQFDMYVSSLSVQTVSQHYHGTSLKCAIYQTISVCNDRKCGICGIVQRGILLEYKSSNILFQRFGDGFYLAPNSSKCHDYTQGHGQYRAMLLFDVAEGRKYTVTNDNTALKAPPSGYDSVYGQSGGSLNYDEIIVYKPEALLPTHILIYQKDGVQKIAQ